MQLPDLPQQNKHKEADFGLRFRKWWNLHGKGSPYELKDSRGKDYISFAEITPEQIAFALACGTDKGVLVRVERGTVGTADYIGIKNTIAYIIINYPKACEVITINNFIHEKEKNKRKSLTYERAKAISSVSII